MTAKKSQILIRSDKLGRAKCEHCDTLLDVSDFHVFEIIECPECGKTTTVPSQLGDYILLRELGRGGMGAVFLARDTRLGRKVALKVLNAGYGKNPEFVDSLLQEAKATAALNHPNIVHLFSFGQVYHQPYFVMELIEGIRLDECIGVEVEPDEAGWLELLGQVVDGLANAQSQGVIHGDVKPANLLLNAEGMVKISDFGIARFGESGPSDTIYGTPMYIAPEKARGRSYDHRADQFSLGASFWHLITGKPPFVGKTSKAVVLNRFEKAPPDLRDHLPDLSPEFSGLVLKMMALDPDERYDDFYALKSELSCIQSVEPSGGSQPAPGAPVRTAAADDEEDVVSGAQNTGVPINEQRLLYVLWALVAAGFGVVSWILFFS